jgi:hypothetical protein
LVLRGNRSLFGNNEALIVIDQLSARGLHMNQSNDIDNVTILKGAAATALYGAGGSKRGMIYKLLKGKGRNYLSTIVVHCRWNK